MIWHQRFPILGYRHTLSGRLNRTVGNREVYFYVDFFDADGTRINPLGPPKLPNTGWGGGSGSYYYPGAIFTTDPNDTWNLFSVTFGPGSNTYIPPSAKSFQMGAFILNGAGNTTCRFADFSVVVSL